MSSNRIALIVAGILLLLTLGVVVRGTSEPAVADPRPIPTAPPAPKHAWQDATLTTAGDLKYAILKEGTGPTAAKGDLVGVNLKGWVAASERPIVDTTGRDIEIIAGKGDMVEGLEMSLVQMKVGEIRQIHVPAALGYGQTGQPPMVPRDADLVYELELRSAAPPPTIPENPPPAPTDREIEGVKLADLAPGEGPEAADGDAVKVHLTTWLEDGTLVSSTMENNRPVRVKLGDGSLFAGLEIALRGMKAGARRKAVIPADKAFGAQGRGPIPPNATVIVEVALLEIGSAG